MAYCITWVILHTTSSGVVSPWQPCVFSFTIFWIGARDPAFGNKTYPKRDLQGMGVWQKWSRTTAVAIYVAEEKAAVEIPEKGKLDIRSLSIHLARGGLPTDRALEIRWLTIRYQSNVWPGTWERKANRFAPLMPLYYSMRRLSIHCNAV